MVNGRLPDRARLRRRAGQQPQREAGLVPVIRGCAPLMQILVNCRSFDFSENTWRIRLE